LSGDGERLTSREGQLLERPVRQPVEGGAIPGDEGPVAVVEHRRRIRGIGRSAGGPVGTPGGQPSAGAGSAGRLVRTRRLPSCMAWTRPPGMVRPSSTRSLGSRCGSGIEAAHGSLPANRSSAVWIVKSAGVTSDRSSQLTGNDTGVPGRARGLYAATTV